ncbi:MAG: class I SAM-dependent RNA methyltransferase [Acidimicrobiia bacterium]|nr:class I SAM-dependent RNA methyltransferase [Acidimicrobiia bacterium]
MAHGGSAIARRDGKAYFVDGAIPGELITGTIEVDKGSWGRIRLVNILEPSDARTEPACRYFGRCGGCQWQMGDYEAQLEWKREIVAGQLAHLGQHPDPPVRPTVAPGPPYGYRNRMDYRVASGRPALHERKSRQLVPLSECQILHPNLADLMVDLGDLSGAQAITLRTSTTTGETLVAVRGKIPAQASSWGSNVCRITGDGTEPIIGEARLEETVAGVTFRISGTAFFQNNTPGAEQLVRLAAEAATVGETDTLLDAYAGGGLFAATVGQAAGRVVAIEVGSVEARDLQANLNRAGIDDFRIVQAPTEEAIERLDEYWDVVIADPPRRGLGVDGVEAVTAAEPRALVYVSCDPASLARDTALLAEWGYELDWVTPVDMFPHTFHIECVSRFARAY